MNSHNIFVEALFYDVAFKVSTEVLETDFFPKGTEQIIQSQ